MTFLKLWRGANQIEMEWPDHRIVLSDDGANQLIEELQALLGEQVEEDESAYAQVALDIEE